MLRRRVDELCEQRAISLDRDEIEPAVDEHVVDALRVGLDDDVGLVDRPGLCLSVDDRRHLVPDAKLEAAGRRERSDDRVERVHEPAGEELVGVGRRAERASAPEGQLADRRPQCEPVLGELVDAGGGRGRQLPLRDDAAGLEIAQAVGEDVRPDSGKCLGQIRVALRAAHQLQDDEQRPPLADEAQRVRHRAVEVVALFMPAL